MRIQNIKKKFAKGRIGCYRSALQIDLHFKTGPVGGSEPESHGASLGQIIGGEFR